MPRHNPLQETSAPLLYCMLTLHAILLVNLVMVGLYMREINARKLLLSQSDISSPVTSCRTCTYHYLVRLLLSSFSTIAFMSTEACIITFWPSISSKLQLLSTSRRRRNSANPKPCRRLQEDGAGDLAAPDSPQRQWMGGLPQMQPCHAPLSRQGLATAHASTRCLSPAICHHQMPLLLSPGHVSEVRQWQPAVERTSNCYGKFWLLLSTWTYIATWPAVPLCRMHAILQPWRFCNKKTCSIQGLSVLPGSLW